MFQMVKAIQVLRIHLLELEKVQVSDSQDFIFFVTYQQEQQC